MSIIDFFAGCLGGAAGVLVGHPLDTIKVKLQLNQAVKFNRWGDLYKGISSPLSFLAVINAVVFGVHGYSQRNLIYASGTSSTYYLNQFLIGSLAGSTQAIISCPMELIKTKMQVSKRKAKAINIIKTIIKTDGPKGLFRGLNATFYRDAPAFGIYFSSYELILKYMDSLSKSGYKNHAQHIDDLDNRPPDTWKLIISGGLAGSLSWVLSYPIDVVKTRIQMSNNKIIYKSSLDCFRKLYQREGAKVFLKGFTPTIVRAFPVNATTFTVVTYTLYYFEQKYKEDNLISVD